MAGPQLAPSFFSPKRPCRLHARALLAAPEGASKVRVKVMDTLPWIPITQPREVDAWGVILRVVPASGPHQAELVRAYRESGVLTELGEGRYGLPGFVDIHVHAPQCPQAALALDEPLYQWLPEKTFPLKSSIELACNGRRRRGAGPAGWYL
ncbi:hypothetical protein [Paratractidigestivibacter faecalis]|uniref:Amidohydrolase-related domain-containing protein n=1 Tax=Paratractidigestivibacter faecalis TaxID=2292441 RepID=A0ABV1IHJ6_9ACTN